MTDDCITFPSAASQHISRRLVGGQFASTSGALPHNSRLISHKQTKNKLNDNQLSRMATKSKHSPKKNAPWLAIWRAICLLQIALLSNRRTSNVNFDENKVGCLNNLVSIILCIFLQCFFGNQRLINANKEQANERMQLPGALYITRALQTSDNPLDKSKFHYLSLSLSPQDDRVRLI